MRNVRKNSMVRSRSGVALQKFGPYSEYEAFNRFDEIEQPGYWKIIKEVTYVIQRKMIEKQDTKKVWES